MNGVAASVENIQNGSFPLARPLNLVTKDERAPLKLSTTSPVQPPSTISSRSSFLSPSDRDAKLMWALSASALFASGLLVFILVFLAKESWPVVYKIGLAKFVRADGWHPTEGAYGLTPMLAASLAMSGMYPAVHSSTIFASPLKRTRLYSSSLVPT